jgi:hypothetical protein
MGWWKFWRKRERVEPPGDRLEQAERATVEIDRTAAELRRRVRQMNHLGPLIADALRAPPRPER